MSDMKSRIREKSENNQAIKVDNKIKIPFLRDWSICSLLEAGGGKKYLVQDTLLKKVKNSPD